MANLSKFEFNGNDISFSSGNEDVFVNATDMAKPFGKTPKDWLRLKSTTEYLEELSAVRQIPLTEIVIIRQGGSNQGTWLNQDASIEYARWLNARMAIWCNDRIKELMKHGFTAAPETLEDLINNPELLIGLANKLQQEREAREISEKVIQVQAPKVEYHDKVLGSATTHTSTTIAKELGMSAMAFHKKLKAQGIMFRTDQHWVLYAKYHNQGFTKTRTATYYDTFGEPKTAINTVWTEKGREFLHKILNPELIHQTQKV